MVYRELIQGKRIHQTMLNPQFWFTEVRILINREDNEVDWMKHQFTGGRWKVEGGGAEIR